ncbi:hypothetical protein OB905_10870 [Halobacteria archaeon AArc-dxtr1]|nr:hypothetical protein [Halobacteria archaeon AArc-dxtr1]
MNLLYFSKFSESFMLNGLYELNNSEHNVAVCARHNPDPNVTHDELDQLDIPVHYLGRPVYSDVPELLSRQAIYPG